jgi:hypothetical protein
VNPDGDGATVASDKSDALPLVDLSDSLGAGARLPVDWVAVRVAQLCADRYVVVGKMD